VHVQTLSEQQVIARFLADPSEDTFGELYRAVSPRIFRYFLVRFYDRGVAEELTQDVMLAAYRQSRQLRDPELFRPWIFKIALNALRKHLRHDGRQVVTTELDAVCSRFPAPGTDPLAGRRFSEWMAFLDPEEREMMTLRYVDGLEYHEIASVLKFPLGTVQWKLFHSRRKLAKRFGDAGIR
jgi:RNA polymerase sigma-70 factor (ECF subfamily)